MRDDYKIRKYFNDLIQCIVSEYDISPDEARIKLGNFILSSKYADLIENWKNICIFRDISNNLIDFYKFRDKGPDNIA